MCQSNIRDPNVDCARHEQSTGPPRSDEMLSIMKQLAELRTALLVGPEPRRSRVHDLSGTFIGYRAMATDFPRSLLGAALRRGFGRYPVSPWIPYPAIRKFESLLSHDWDVLESGSGMSTLWWAPRVRSITSIEASDEWYGRLRELLDRRGYTNVTLEKKTGDDYEDLTRFESSAFDLVVADGHSRQLIVKQAGRLCRRPGYVYLDDSDKASRWFEHWGQAVEALRQLAQSEGGRIDRLTGVKPATAVACSGLLLTLPSPRE